MMRRLQHAQRQAADQHQEALRRRQEQRQAARRFPGRPAAPGAGRDEAPRGETTGVGIHKFTPGYKNLLHNYENLPAGFNIATSEWGRLFDEKSKKRRAKLSVMPLSDSNGEGTIYNADIEKRWKSARRGQVQKFPEIDVYISYYDKEPWVIQAHITQTQGMQARRYLKLTTNYGIIEQKLIPNRFSGVNGRFEFSEKSVYFFIQEPRRQPLSDMMIDFYLSITGNIQGKIHRQSKLIQTLDKLYKHNEECEALRLQNTEGCATNERNQEQIRTLEGELETLRLQNTEGCATNERNQEQIRELTARNRSLETELRALRQQNTESRATNERNKEQIREFEDTIEGMPRGGSRQRKQRPRRNTKRGKSKRKNHTRGRKQRK
jgi:hypothetical protein